MTGRTFEQLIAQALQSGGIDTSLLELMLACHFDVADELGSAIAVRERIEPFGLGLFPGFSEGGLRTGRVLRLSSRVPPRDIRALLASSDESSSLELKSSMVCCLKRFAATGVRSRSDGVVHSVLKTICGFANASGGTLLVGVDDSKSPVGLVHDYGCGIASADQWQLELASLISGRILNGNRVGHYVNVEVVDVDGLDVAVIDVVARRDLTFLKSEDKQRWEYYVRNGNKTERIDIESFEEHLLRKRGLLG